MISHAGSLRLRIENLSHRFGLQPVLHDINLSIGAGEIMVLVGPSGCGKSTLLRLIAGIEKCQSGRVNLYGATVSSPKLHVPPEKRDVGLVFQDYALFPHLSVLDNVCFGLNKLARAARRPTALAALEQVGMTHLSHRYPHELSGGQQQRLCIARTLAVNPEIILMDEPASALDPISTAKIEELITQLKEHYTIIIVTHNMQQAARVSDVTAFFYLGELIESGGTRKIFTNPEKKQTEDYITGRFG